MNTVLVGLPAAPGIGIGQIVIHSSLATETWGEVTAADPEAEWQRFLTAQRQVDDELARSSGQESPLIAEIFAAHRYILQDATLLEAVHRAIDEGHNAVHATYRAITELADVFRALEDEYFAGRAADILDIGQRLLAHLGAPAQPVELATLPPNTVLIAGDLAPSELAQLPADHVVGIVLAFSTPTAHSAILARSLGIPLICTAGDSVLDLSPGHTAVVNGHNGRLLIDPGAEEMQRQRAAQQDFLQVQATASAHAAEPAITLDGVHIPVYANANGPEDIGLACLHGADGVGLLRTEYLFQDRPAPPTVEEQERSYRAFAQQLRQRLLTVRALDAGGDKPIAYMAVRGENNPFLGQRGIRLLLQHPRLLRDQFSALLRVARDLHGELEFRFMLPMVATVEELHSARKLLDELTALESAVGDGVDLVKVGVLIEVPAAALMARHLASLVDYFSIGTNDLAQYVLASDRTNSSVAGMADPLHPAVLQLIKATCDAARQAGMPVSLCGELAGDFHAVSLLLGLGVTEFSAPLPAVALVKQSVRRCQLPACQRLAAAALECDSSHAVRRLLATEPYDDQGAIPADYPEAM